MYAVSNQIVQLFFITMIKKILSLKICIVTFAIIWKGIFKDVLTETNLHFNACHDSRRDC